MGRGLLPLLADCEVSTLSRGNCDLTSIPEAEVALAGGDTVVFLARASGRPARVWYGSRGDYDLLLADTMARAAPRTSVRQLVIFACQQPDPREARLRSSGLPLSVLRGGGTNPSSELAALVSAPAAERALEAWRPPSDGPLPAPAPSVCSIQSLAVPPGWTAEDVAVAHLEWLGRIGPLVRVTRSERVWHIQAAGLTVLTLVHLTARSEPHSCVMEMAGGALAKRAGRFEVRLLGEGQGLAVLIGFEPTLPWPVYRITQAPLHSIVMKRFARWLRTQPAKA